MTLHTDQSSKERILMMGPWGTGKSEAWCAIAKYLALGKSENKVFVLDTDNAVDRLVEGQPYEDKIVGFDLDEWPDFKAGIRKARELANPNRQDWLVLDMADKAWDRAQDYYVQETYGKDPAEFFLDWRKEGKAGSPLAGDYGINWQVINSIYSDFMGKVQRFPGHVLACTPIGALNRDVNKESKEVVDTYGRFGVKPQGQKALAHQFHTILMTGIKGKGYIYTTVKDRKRSNLAGEDVADFVTSYLVKVAGWKL